MYFPTFVYFVFNSTCNTPNSASKRIWTTSRQVLTGGLCVQRRQLIFMDGIFSHLPNASIWYGNHRSLSHLILVLFPLGQAWHLRGLGCARYFLWCLGLGSKCLWLTVLCGIYVYIKHLLYYIYSCYFTLYGWKGHLGLPRYSAISSTSGWWDDGIFLEYIQFSFLLIEYSSIINLTRGQFPHYA